MLRFFAALACVFLSTGLFAQNYNMTNGTINTCSGTFYDSGGAAGAYGNNQNFTLTFCSSTAGQQIYFTFTSFALENNWDYLYVYNGPNTASPLIGTYTGTNSPGTVASTNGCLTFRFTSDGSVTPAGWVAQIGCGTPPPPPPAPPTAICGTAQPFCTGTTITFPAGVNNGSAFSGSYNCLGSSPNPAWYYLQIQNPGNITLTMQSSPAVDIDYIMWGPFPSISVMCQQYSLANVVACSYSAASVETASLTGTTTGQVYLLLITNYSNQNTNVSFNQTAGNATTNCNILCNMTQLTANPSVCNPATNTYSVSGQVTFMYPPTNGTFTISSNCGGSTVSVPSNISLASPYSYTLNNIPATGGNCSVTASFSSDPNCTLTTNYSSPQPCNCGMSVTGSMTPASCLNTSDGSVSVTVNGAVGTPTYSWSAPGGNTNSLSGLPVGNYTCYIIDPGASNCNTSITINVTAAPDPIAPTIQNCPTNLNLPNDPGSCGAVVAWTTPTVTDNCSATLSQTAGLTSGAFFPLGTSTISYQALDLAGNTAVCSFDVTVTDTENPVFVSCPGNITQTNDIGLCGAVVNWAAPTFSDNCPAASMVQSQGLASGSVFPLGTTTVEYIVTDAAGLSDTCSFTVTITDNEPPVFLTCPANISQTNDLGVCGALINWAAPTFSDNCPGVNLVQTQGPASGSVFPLGTTTVEFVVTDAVGLSDTCSFTVTITDNEAPLFLTCPANISQTNDLGMCGAVVNWVDPAFSDNCPGANVVQTQGLASGSFFPLGTTTVEFVVTDAVGLSDTCSFSVTITDNENPVIVNCPANITQNNDLGNCGAIVTWTVPTVSDNCPNANIIQTSGIANGGFFPLGTSTIVYTATDAAGNTANCTFDITVVDSEAPQLSNCPANINQANDIGQCGAVLTWTAPTFSDNCPGANMVQTQGLPSGSLFPLGTTTIQYILTDAVGLTDTCTFDLTVTDNENPQIHNCPADITVPNDPGICGAVVVWTLPTVTDNCPNANIVQTQGLPSGSLFPAGTSQITYVATDASGNTDTCSFSITINDPEPPLITNCPADMILNNDLGNCGAVVNWTTPTATDNCPGVVLQQTSGLASGSLFPLGTTTVTYIATDNAGQSDTCSFDITVIDNEAPIFINCPAAISVNNDPGACGALVNWTLPTAVDHCPGVVVAATHNPNSFFALGTTTVTYIATDAVGFTDTCFFTVTVTDNENPTLANCPANLSLSANNNCEAVANWTAPTLNDNCPGVIMASNFNSGATFPLGTTTVTYTATDAVGLTATCSFTVNVSDNTPPLITNCPSDMVHNVGPNCDHSVSWTVPTVSDNCTGVSMLSNFNPGDSFPFGTTTVTYIATDAVGLHDTCSFTIQVIDDTPPVIVNCPVNLIVNLAARCDTMVNWVLPTATDNCPGVQLTASHTPNSVFGLGTTVVTYYATDGAGLKDTCSFTITVNPPAPIQSTVSQLVQPNCFGQNGTATVSVTGGSGAYNYAWTSVPVQTTPSATLAAGNYVVAVSDALAAACVALDTNHVQIIAPQALSLTLNKTNPSCFGFTDGSINSLLSGGTLPYTYTWNSNPPQYTPNASGLGVGTYSLNVVDDKGCSISQTLSLTQPDSLSATFSQTNIKCFGDAVGLAKINVSGGTQPYQYNWTNGVSTTNIASNLPAGIYTVTVTDAQNCTISRTYQLTQPAAPLSATVSTTDATCYGSKDGSATASATGGTAPYTFTWNSSPLQTGANASNLASKPYKLTVKDANGCLFAVDFSIEQPARVDVQVVDIQHPYCDSANGSVLLNTTGGTAPYTYLWDNDSLLTQNPLTAMGEGTHTCTVTDAQGCKDALSLSLTNTPPALAAFTSNPLHTDEIFEADGYVKFQNQSSGAVAYSWNFGDGFASTLTHPSHTYTQAGTYSVQLIAYNRYFVCPTTYELTYTILPNGDIFIPNVFTPNQDGANDVWAIGGRGIRELNCQIFDRWGREVYVLKQFGETWDGKDQSGNELPEGSYAYKLAVRLNDGRTLNRAGSVMILK